MCTIKLIVRCICVTEDYHAFLYPIQGSEVEPPSCHAPFSTEVNGLHYFWAESLGEKAATTAVGIFRTETECWSIQKTTGCPPHAVCSGGCASIGKNMFCFGGDIDSSGTLSNDLHVLNLETFKWSELHPLEKPLCKSGCGLVAVDERTLGCFGGFDYGPTQQRSTFIRNPYYSNRSGWTNEFHLFDVKTGTITPIR